MNDNKVNWAFLLRDTRAKVYLLWAVLTFVGFATTHYYQNANINGVWAGLSIIGLGYMFKVMPLRVKAMKHILWVWLAVIVVGIALSALVVYASSPAVARQVQYLGAFWLVIMGLGYAFNGLVDEPAGWYYGIAAVNVVVAVLCYFVPQFTVAQYLVAAIVSAWSMLSLWIFRT